MAKITFITQEGEKVTLEGDSGSVMQLAVQHGVKGIDGDCGGVCSCATCHVHVPENFMEVTGKATDVETFMLELEENVSENSRLSCQLKISDALDGIELQVAR